MCGERPACSFFGKIDILIESGDQCVFSRRLAFAAWKPSEEPRADETKAETERPCFRPAEAAQAALCLERKDLKHWRDICWGSRPTNPWAGTLISAGRFWFCQCEHGSIDQNLGLIKNLWGWGQRHDVKVCWKGHLVENKRFFLIHVLNKSFSSSVSISSWLLLLLSL